MSKVLVVKSSANGDASVSNRLLKAAVADLQRQDPALEIIERDLGAAPVPHLTAEGVAALFGAARTAAEAATGALSDELIVELRTADTLVIGAPMYNFGISSTLKAWFDHVLRAGVTFRYTDAGPEGLLQGKRAIVVLARGGLYSEGPAQAMDAQEPHLRTLLGFIGITDVTFVRAEQLAFGDDARTAAIGAAESQLSRALRQAAA